MTQSVDLTVSTAQSGTAYGTEINSVLQAFATLHSGASRPSYIVAGMMWMKDVSATAKEIYQWDGVDDILMFELDWTANTFKAAKSALYDGSRNYVADSSGAANTITFSPTPARTAYTTGEIISIKLANTNTGAVTGTMNGIAGGAKSFYKNKNQELQSGDLVSGGIYQFEWDGSAWQLQSPVDKSRPSSASASIASAGTCDIGTIASALVNITGTTTITAFGSSATTNAPIYFLTFAAALTLTHNATSLILPGGANITTATGDGALAQYLGSGNWQVLQYFYKTPVASNTLMMDHRLTLVTATPVTTTDQLAKTTVYMTPYRGNKISLYDGSATWNTRSTAEISVSVPSNTNTPFDIFCYDNAGVPTLEALAWTNDTTRATALVLQDGIPVKSGNTTRRYIGTGRTTGSSGQTEDSLAKRFLWNQYNRVLRQARGTFASDRTTTSTSYAEINSEIRASFVLGQSEDAVSAMIQGTVTTPTSGGCATAIGFDGTAAEAGFEVTSLDLGASGSHSVSCGVSGLKTGLAAGGHYATLLGSSGAGGSTQTWPSSSTVTGATMKSKVYLTVGVLG